MIPKINGKRGQVILGWFYIALLVLAMLLFGPFLMEVFKFAWFGPEIDFGSPIVIGAVGFFLLVIFLRRT